ncbi:UDP-GlcNAc:betaGal beta-1,3-N-acetylglucosaminyltransferase 8 [Ambystoma mexicanum]|uniref:UDP-GlcNAc:betaGal beta-1,3-N-acetylglucosaminyltransferase 8 n=1 Tax=Ambystoma mexicanum TaxID=8296 RepID=UPI0037E922CF
MRIPRCMIVLLSLFLLITIGTYINWTAPPPLPKEYTSLDHSKTWWSSAPITTLSSVSITRQGFVKSNFSVTSLLNMTLSLKDKILIQDAYWNKKQHAIFRKLESQVNLSSSCGASDDVGSQITDFHTYPELHKQFVLYSGCRDFPLLINQPNKCSQNQTFLLLAIKSVPKNFDRRQAVRETWGREMNHSGLQIRTVFLLGTDTKGTDPDLSHLVRFENDHFQDILQWDFQDSFFNLTLKDNLFLKWVTIHCPHARFIFKGDDDVFANPLTIMQYLESLEHEKADVLYMGHVVTNASPFRESKSKYYIPNSFYMGSYPAYAGGGGFVFSGTLAKWLYLISQYIEFYPIDDVYTGLCFHALQVNPQMHPEFQTFDIAEKERDNPCTHKKLLLVHQRSTQQLIRLWRRMQDPDLQC